MLQNLYFSISTLNIQYLTIEGQPEIFSSDVGFVETVFTDADFDGLDSCHTTNQFARPLQPKSHLKGLLL